MSADGPSAPADGPGAQQAAEAAAPKAGASRSQARSAARLAAVQALYQLEMTGASWREVAQEFETHRFGLEIDGARYHDADRAHFRNLIEGAVARQREIDPATHEALVESWPLAKVDPILRAIFRAAGAEFLTAPSVPPRVTINEYVDVAKAFFPSGDAPRFANAVLDAAARRLRPGEMPPRDAATPSEGAGEAPSDALEDTPSAAAGGVRAVGRDGAA